MKIGRLLILVSGLFLAGCNETIRSVVPGVELIRAGAQLQLIKPLQFPPFGDYLYIQAGAVIPLKKIIEVEPHCYLSLRQPPKQVTEILPDTFIVYKVHYSQDTFGYLPGTQLVFGSDSHLTQLFYKVDLYLESAEQPDVYRFTCQVDRNQASGMEISTYPSVSEIRKAFGKLILLNTAVPFSN